MAVINFARRDIEAKIVYYGPAFSGKTTNVKVLYEQMSPTQRGELHSLATEADRTLFFDYVPIQLGQIGGFTARFKLFTVPGQVVYQQTRKVLLQGADAVVFVADSSPDRAEANLDSLVDLEENLRAHGLDLSSIPLVIQLNKRDAPGARPVAAMLSDLNPFGVPYVEAVASEGKGSLETLKLITDIAGQRIRENLSGQKTALKLSAVDKADAEDDRKVVRDHIERIKKVRPEENQREQAMHASGRVHVGKADTFIGAKALENPAQGDATKKLPDSKTNTSYSSGSLANGNTDPKAVSRPTADSVYEVSRPRTITTERKLPPPPPPPPSTTASTSGASSLSSATANWPVGSALEAYLEGDSPLKAKEVLGGMVSPDGRVRMEVVLDKGSGLARHTVTLVARPPVKAGMPSWAVGVAAGLLGLGVGLAAGIALGWMLAGR